jgi:hypothetical protein
MQGVFLLCKTWLVCMAVEQPQLPEYYGARGPRGSLSHHIGEICIKASHNLVTLTPFHPEVQKLFSAIEIHSCDLDMSLDGDGL